jgi:hypothetical protein
MTSAIAISWTCSGLLTSRLIADKFANVWFGSDCNFIYKQVASRWSGEHYRARRHPLFPLLLTPAFWVANRLAGIPAELFVRSVLALAAAGSVVLFYVLSLKVTRGVISALLWTCLFLGSSGHLFWCGALETFYLGVPSLLTPFLVIAALRKTKYLEVALLWSIVFSFSVTLTNVMSGIASAASVKPLRDVWCIVKTAVCVLLVATAVQVKIIPASRDGMWFLPYIRDELRWIKPSPTESLVSRPLLALTSGVIVPEVTVLDEPPADGSSPYRGLTVRLRYASYGVGGVVVWIVLLGLAVAYSASKFVRCSGLYLAVALVAAGQVVLHTIYGSETFLYSAHYAPVLILFSAYACRTRFRRIAVALAVALLAIEIANNVPAFLWSADYVRTLAAAG